MKGLSILLCLIWLLAAPAFIYAEPAASVDPASSIELIVSDPFTPPSLVAVGAVVIDQKTGTVLFGKNEHHVLYPASTTKVLTALLAIELGDLQEVVTVGNEVLILSRHSSMAGLYVHEEITLEHLIYGLMVNSGNDAANTIAVHLARQRHGADLCVSGALAKFSDMMNERAHAAGALHSNFVNAHGYHDPNHYSTAYDLAMIAREAMELPFFREVAATTLVETAYWHNGEPRYWRNRNRLLNSRDKDYYPDAIGVKTGFTTPSGSCLISAASRNDQDRIAVILNSDRASQWKDSRDLLEFGLTQFTYTVLLEEGAIIESLPLEGYDPDDWGTMAIALGAGYSGIFPAAALPHIQQDIRWEAALLAAPGNEQGPGPRLMAPLEKGQMVGQLTLRLNGQTLTNIPLLSTRDVRRRTIMERILPPQPNPAAPTSPLRRPLMAGFTILVLLRITMMIIRRRRRRRHRLLFRY